MKGAARSFMAAGDDQEAPTGRPIGMKQEIALSAAWTAASNWTEQVVALVVYVAIARLIGAEAFGIASMAFAIVLLGEALLRDTLTEGLISRDGVDPKADNAVFWGLIAFGLTIFIALYVAAPFVGAMFKEPDVAPLMQAFAPATLLVAFNGVPIAKLRRELAFRALAVRAIAGVLAGGAVGVGMALEGFGAWSLVGQRLTYLGVNAALAWISARWLPSSPPRFADLARVGGLGPKVVVLRALTIAIGQTPTIALGIAAGPKAVALYALAARLVEVALFLVVTPLKRVVQPAIAAMKRAGGDTRGLFADVSEIAAMTAFASFAGLAFVAEPLVGVLIGPEWRGAGAIIPALCIAGALAALTEVQEGYLLALDRSGRFLRAALAEALIGFVVVGLAAYYGPVAAAGAVALRAALILPTRVSAALAAERIPVRQYLRTLAGPLAATAGMSITLFAWRFAVAGRLPDLVFLAATVFIGAATFVVAALFATPSTFRRLRVYLKAPPAPDQ
jgi:O-antigen/teichoic acid export membrane protein